MNFNIQRVLNETFDNISADKFLFYSTVLTLTVIFTLFNFFGVFAINLYNLGNFMKSSIQVKIYLDDDITADGADELTKKLYSFNEVQSVKYVSEASLIWLLSKKGIIIVLCLNG